MRLKNALARYRQWRSTRDTKSFRYLHPDARVCRRSRLCYPCHVSEAASLIRTTLGRFSYVARGTRVQDCSVGPYASIGPECLVGGLGRHPTDHFSTSPLTYSPGNPMSRLLGDAGFDLGFEENASVVIGPDVWIGARVIVADGVEIGAGAIIGASTVVTKNVPPYAIVYGSPPEIRRFRFPPEVIERLIKSEWWTGEPGGLAVEELREIVRPRVPRAGERV